MQRGPGDSSFPFHRFTKTQLSLRVYFPVTENKAQEQLFSIAGWLDLTDTVFSQDQLHVGRSRDMHPDKLKVCLPPDLLRQTKHVVYPEDPA